MDGNKKARMKRAQRMALRNGRQDRVFNGTYQDCPQPEEQKTGCCNLQAACSLALKDWRSGIDTHRPAATREDPTLKGAGS